VGVFVFMFMSSIMGCCPPGVGMFGLFLFCIWTYSNMVLIILIVLADVVNCPEAMAGKFQLITKCNKLKWYLAYGCHFYDS